MCINQCIEFVCVYVITCIFSFCIYMSSRFRNASTRLYSFAAMIMKLCREILITFVLFFYLVIHPLHPSLCFLLFGHHMGHFHFVNIVKYILETKLI